MFIDTHTHLFSDSFAEDRDEVLHRAIKSGVEVCLLPNIDVDTIDAMHHLSFIRGGLKKCTFSRIACVLKFICSAPTALLP